jgi:hypothetical protein
VGRKFIVASLLAPLALSGCGITGLGAISPLAGLLTGGLSGAPTQPGCTVTGVVGECSVAALPAATTSAVAVMPTATPVITMPAGGSVTINPPPMVVPPTPPVAAPPGPVVTPSARYRHRVQSLGRALPDTTHAGFDWDKWGRPVLVGTLAAE